MALGHSRSKSVTSKKKFGCSIWEIVFEPGRDFGDSGLDFCIIFDFRKGCIGQRGDL